MSAHASVRSIMIRAAAFILVIGCGSNTRPCPLLPPEPVKLEPANFKARIDHAYLPMAPGTTYTIRETHEGKIAENIITVLAETKTIMGVGCIVVHDKTLLDGKLVEDTYDWFAQDKQGNVWFFGEAIEERRADGTTSTEESWQAGVDGAWPGIAMPARPKPGMPYRQEYVKEAAEMAQIIALGESVTVPAGTYADCVKTKEWSVFESGYNFKWYCRGVGVVRTQSTDGHVAELLSVTKP